MHYPQGRQPLVVYRQAFTGPCARHCVNCFRLVEGCSLPQDAVLQGSLDLFCSLDCERLFFIKNSSSERRHVACGRAERQCGVQTVWGCAEGWYDHREWWLPGGAAACLSGRLDSSICQHHFLLSIAAPGGAPDANAGSSATVLLMLPGGIRRALFKLERGVCQACRLDCHALVQQLQQISKDTPGWQAQRRAVVAHRAPAFLARGCTTYLDKLLDQVRLTRVVVLGCCC